MIPDSKPPSSLNFTSEEAPTARHRLEADALAHLCEIQEEVEKSIQFVESNKYSPYLRIGILNSLSEIKKKIRQFEKDLGVY
jgi:hypothetical protein